MEATTHNSAIAPTTTPLAILRRRWPLLVIATVIVPLVAALLAAVRPVEYEASAVLRADPNPFSKDLLGPNQPVLAPTLGQGASTIDRLASLVAKSQGGSPRKLGDKITITVEPEQSGAEIEARGTSAQEAADLANSFAKAYVADAEKSLERQIERALRLVAEQLPDAERSGDKREIRQVRRRVHRLSALQRVSDNRVRIVRAAERPDEVSPITRNLFLGLILGALLGAFAAFIAERLDGRLHRREDVEQVVWPVLGCIDSAGPERGTECGDALARLRHLGGRTLARTIALIPVGGGSEVAGTLAGDLANAAASANQKPLALDADLRRRSDTPGVRQFVLDGTSLEELTVQRPTDGSAEPVRTLASGSGEEPALAILEHSRMRELLREAASQYDATFIALPPLDQVADGLTIAAEVDAVVLAVTLTRSTARQLRRCRAELMDAGVTPAGAILTTVRGLRAGKPVESATGVGRARQDAVALS